jgi:hypothetical protein
MEEESENGGEERGRGRRRIVPGLQLVPQQPLLQPEAPLPFFGPVDQINLTPSAFADTIQALTVHRLRAPVEVVTGAISFIGESIASALETARNLIQFPVPPLIRPDSVHLQPLVPRVVAPPEVASTSNSPFTFVVRASASVNMNLCQGLMDGVVGIPVPPGFELDSGSRLAILAAVFQNIRGNTNRKATSVMIVCPCGKEFDNFGGEDRGMNAQCLICGQYSNMRKDQSGGTNMTKTQHFVSSVRQNHCMMCRRSTSVDKHSLTRTSKNSFDCLYPCNSRGGDPLWNHFWEKIGSVGCLECNRVLHSQKPWILYLLEIISLRAVFGADDVFASLNGRASITAPVQDQMAILDEHHKNRLAATELLLNELSGGLPLVENSPLQAPYACNVFREANDSVVAQEMRNRHDLHDLANIRFKISFSDFAVVLKSGHREGHVLHDHEDGRQARCKVSATRCNFYNTVWNDWEISTGKRLNMDIQEARGSDGVREAIAGRAGTGNLSCSRCWMPGQDSRCSSNTCGVAGSYGLNPFHLRATLNSGHDGHSCIGCHLSAREFRNLSLLNEAKAATGGTVQNFSVDASYPPNSHRSLCNLQPMCWKCNHFKKDFSLTYTAAILGSGLALGPGGAVPGAFIKANSGIALSVEDASNVSLAINGISIETVGVESHRYAQLVGGEIAVAAARACFEAFPLIVGDPIAHSKLENMLAQVVYDTTAAGMVAFAVGQLDNNAIKRQNAAQRASAQMLASINAIMFRADLALAQAQPNAPFAGFLNQAVLLEADPLAAAAAERLSQCAHSLLEHIQITATPQSITVSMDAERISAEAESTAKAVRTQTLNTAFSDAKAAAIAASASAAQTPGNHQLKAASNQAWLRVAESRNEVMRAKEELQERRLVGPVRPDQRPLGKGSGNYVVGSFGMSSHLENYQLDHCPIPHYVEPWRMTLVYAERDRLKRNMEQLRVDTDYILLLADAIVAHQNTLAHAARSPFYTACADWRRMLFK